ncbi:MAG: 2OG-Fe(II) oxygenase family protein [Halioglobus sp.]|nr:2OG-Fe(II) oxygenase family protein [Halioglobus sp.]
MSVPTIDLSNPSAASLAALDAACRDHGFFLIEGHGLDAVIERTWDTTERFFASKPQQKHQLMRKEGQPTGYYDRELTKRVRDRKEVFDLLSPALPPEFSTNVWPNWMPDLQKTLTEYFDVMGAAAEKTLQLVLAALNLPPDLAAQYHGSPLGSLMRLNHYTLDDPTPTSDRENLAPLGDLALGPHTDPGVITLLLQDQTGGLQTESAEHGWIDVPPRPGTIVVNLGDSLQVWSNDHYQAAVHRVTPMRATDRYSIPFFLNPTFDAVIEPIPELCGGNPRYHPFTWREFGIGRANDNYADIGAEDIQISKYRVA